MKVVSVIATGTAALFAAMLFATSVADARRGGGGISRGGGGFSRGAGRSVGRSMSRGPRMAHRGPAARHSPSRVAHRTRNPSINRGQRKQVAAGKRNNLAQHKRNASGPAARKQVAGKSNLTPQQKRNVAGGAVRNQAAKKGLGTATALGLGAAGAVAGTGLARNLPVSKAVAGSAVARGRVAVPPNVRPRLTLVKAPATYLRPRFAPFVQRHWRRAFFWASVAGVGYLTIPQLYYDRFYGCVNVPDPNYGCAVDLLSAAALEEENEATRVRYPMPTEAAYRYSASAAPKQKTTCSFNPFVERKWNHPFVWVQIPSVGNVTVPEDYYDRFYTSLVQEPPDYPAACKLLVEAVAAETVAASAPPPEPEK
jgi:hypothetical protein